MRNVPCPTCGVETEFSEQNLFRPFCSKRCRLIDLGEWADEKYRVPEKPASQIVNDIEEDGDESSSPK